MPLSVDFPPLRIGVAGLGRAGLHHVERIGLREDCQVVALHDDCPAARERVRGLRAAMRAAWGELLADRDVEVVLLATPPALHAELAIAALAAGKHVLVETPLCLNLVEADAVTAASRRSGRSVIVAHTRRWEEDFRTAQATLDSGELGRLVALKLINRHYNPRRVPARSFSSRDAGSPSVAAQVSHRETGSDFPGRQTGSASDVWHWRDHAASGGGALWEFGIHYFDQLLQLAGRPAESVFARTWGAPGGESDDGFLAIVNFGGDLVAQVEVNRTAAASLSTGWMIDGSSGSYAGSMKYLPTAQGEIVDLPVDPIEGAMDEFYSRLARHLRLGEPNPVPPEEARGSIALIEAVRESSRSGEVVCICH
jgi:predicted dehydrogenase